MIKSSLFLTAAYFGSIFGNQVVNLEPPVLSQETIATEIVCVRPMREGCFNISTQDVAELDQREFQRLFERNAQFFGGSGY
jgi:hypothetical protein